MAAHRVSAFVLVLACAAAAVAGRPEAAAACAETDASACRSRGDRTVSLVQVQQDVDRASAQLKLRAAARQLSSSQVSAHIRAYLAVPGNIGAALAAGMMAVQQAMPFFTEGKVTMGLTTLGTQLFDAVSMIIPEETKETEAYSHVQEAWEDTMQTLTTTDDLIAGIHAFKEDGDVARLMRVCLTVIQDLQGVVTRILPEEVSAEVAKYISALEDAVEGFDDAMVAFAAGNTTASVEAVYAGIKSAVSVLVPEDLQQDETFSAVAGVLDSVFGELSSTVLKYQQQLLQSSVCWKQFTRREHRRPNQCPEDTTFDGSSWCSAAAPPSLLETSVRWKKEKSGSAPSCDEDSEYPEQKGSWCYKDCPAGLEPFHTRCRTVCEGAYPVDSPLLCGKTPGTVSAAVVDMASRAIRTIMDIGKLIDGSAELSATASSLADAGAGFAHPMCPLP